MRRAVAVRRADGQGHRTVGVVVGTVEIEARVHGLVALGTGAFLLFVALAEDVVGTPAQRNMPEG